MFGFVSVGLSSRNHAMHEKGLVLQPLVTSQARPFIVERLFVC
jgi:hypothetical protein